MKLSDLRQLIKEAGVIGAGGAGFPTYMKMDDRVETLIINCAECEPLIKVHQQLLSKKHFEVVKTLKLLADCLELKKVIIAIKSSYEETITSVNHALSFYGDERLAIGELPEVYPVGDEVVTIYETTGQIVQPGQIPLSLGIAVLNVETVFNIYQAVFHGYPVTHKYVTITGAVQEPKTLSVPIGTSIKELIKLVNGTTLEETRVIAGGPMTGKEVTLSNRVEKTTNAIILLPKSHGLFSKAEVSIDMKRAMASCSQCQRCTDMCPRNLLGHPIVPHKFMQSVSSGVVREVKVMINTFFCSQCGVCERYACDQGLSPMSIMAAYRAALREKKVQANNTIDTCEPHELRAYRQIPMDRLKTRIGVAQYDKKAPLEDFMLSVDEVMITFDQHIGMPAEPMVTVNTEIHQGQIIAKGIKDQLSVNYHSSIEGIVFEINDKFAIIKNKRENISGRIRR